MDEKAPKIDDKKFAAHMNKNKKPKTMSSTQKSLADIRKRGEIVRSKKSTAQMRNSAGLKRLGDAMITPKMQRRALASPAAKAKPKSQVTLPKMPKLSIDKDKNKTNEAFDFKVNIDGFPEMFMSGNSPSEVKTHLRKLVKQPSMIQSVDRVTKADKKKHHRDKVRESVEENLEEKEEKKGLWYNIHMKRKRGEKMRKKGEKGAPTADQMARAKGEAVSPAQQAAIAISKKERGEKPKVDELSMSRKDITKSGINPTVTKGADKIKKDLEKLRKGLKKEPLKAGAMKRMSTGDGMNTFKKKPPEVKKANESYAPDEGTPEARKKATKMTPGQEGVMDFLKRAGRKVMGNKPTASNVRKRINTNRGSTSGQQNSIANRINFGGKFSK